MDSARREQLDEIVRLSREMLELAEELEWEKIAVLEVQRKQIVLECFQKPAKQQDAAEVAVVIREILSLNQQVTTLGKQCQTQLGTEIHSHNRGRAATSAYLSHTR
ncbi:protein FliT [Thiogranum longum]|uniref:Flagellar protein FliT n=1 Tax=Thiogranum longum TaxID=1537524 RepID=A0A4R1HDQ7_9GAMM|nr:flagellar protein FliT [Thiogranum longum]TCK18851.1 protein FliT [Thiogranum longum]